MKKVVLKLPFADEKIMKKAMKKVSGLSGVESIAMDPEDKKLTVLGDIDPVSVVDKLRKLCQTEIVSIGPAKEPEKPNKQPKTEEQPKNKDMSECLKAYQEYYKQHYVLPAAPPYYAVSVEENPCGCVIC